MSEKAKMGLHNLVKKFWEQSTNPLALLFKKVFYPSICKAYILMVIFMKRNVKNKHHSGLAMSPSLLALDSPEHLAY